MAKISRRAVASSSASSNSANRTTATATTTNTNSTTTTAALRKSSSHTSTTPAPLNSAARQTFSNGIPAGASATSSSSSSASTSASSSSSTISHGNSIAYVGKPAYQRLSTAEHTAKFVASAFSDHKRGSNAATTTDKNETKHFTAQPTLIDSVDAASPAPPYLQNKTIQAQILAAERERIRAEFFATYDVMTGVRIAATLSGFFGLMVFLIVWKSRSSSNETMKVLKDPKMAAVAAVCMQEEEEREIHEAMVATGMSIYPDEYDTIAYRRQRMMSLGNVSAPPMLNRGYRFSSVGGGGYSSLLEPPRRFSYSAASAAGSLGGGGSGGGGGGGGGRRKSGSESSRVLSNFHMGSSFGNDDYFMETDDELENGDYATQEIELGLVEHGEHALEHEEQSVDEGRHKRTDSTRSKQGFLEVPLMGQDSRRSSAMTCCSTDSSYLERRCSAFTLGLSNLPPSLQRKLSTASRTSSTDNWDYYYPDIQVIQPTPKQSPCPSERSIYEQLHQTTAAEAAAFAASHATISTTSKTAKPNKATTTTLATTTKTTTTTTKPTSTTKTSKQKSVPSGGSNGRSSIMPAFVRKHSIAYYDPESAQAGRKQQIHSISADTVDVYPYNQTIMPDSSCSVGPIQSAPPASIHHHGFHFTESPMEELFLNVRRKKAVVELQRSQNEQQVAATIHQPPAYENNNNFPYTSSVMATKAKGAAVTAAAAAAGATAASASTAPAANSSSLSIDSNPVSIDKLNGSSSMGTVSAKALFNVERRAPLASLSSFKISSLEYGDSEMRSLDEDSAFLDSVADTDEDMQQLSSDSDEASLAEQIADVGKPEIVAATPQPELDVTASTSKMAAARLNQPLRYGVEKRFSLNAGSGNRLRRPLLQRHRTISASSSDRISLLTGQQLKEFPATSGNGSGGSGSGTQTPHSIQKTTPLETHFGTVICTSSPPTHPRRAQLLQQYSDPQSLPTTTTTTATNTEEDTCSTLNTEVVGTGAVSAVNVGGDDADSSCRVASRTSGGFTSGDGGSTTITQHSSLNTVVSFGRISPLSPLDNNNPMSQGSTTRVVTAPLAAPKKIDTSTDSQTKQQQLPRSKLADDPCASSISDSVISTRYPIISMPASLKNLILRGTAGSISQKKAEEQPRIAIVSRSATNLSMFEAAAAGDENMHFVDDVFLGRSPCQVTLELPLIKVPTTDESSESSASDEIERCGRRCKSHGDDSSKSSTHDPSLPASSRKWSKETLF